MTAIFSFRILMSCLVVGFNPFEKYDRQNWILSPKVRGENKQSLKIHHLVVAKTPKNPPEKSDQILSPFLPCLALNCCNKANFIKFDGSCESLGRFGKLPTLVFFVEKNTSQEKKTNRVSYKDHNGGGGEIHFSPLGRWGLRNGKTPTLQ